MVLLKIFNVDRNDCEKPLCILQLGEHVVGRGSFANCNDKKISRNHITINVKDDEATLTLIHVSPIFFMSSNTANIKILKKDQSIRLSDGDKFAFLVDTWYTVKIEHNENEQKAVAGSSVSTVFVSNPTSTNTIIASTSNTVVSQSTSIKRNIDDSYSEERKKLKLMTETLDKLKDSIDQIVAQSNEEDNKETSKEAEKDTTTQVFKRGTISDSDDEDSDAEMLPEVTRDTEIVERVQDNSEENSEARDDIDNNNANADKTNSEILDDITKEPMINEVEKNEVKIEHQEEQTDKKENIDEVNSANLGTNEISDGHENDTVEPAEDRETAQNPVDASASSSGASMGNTVRREQCWYGQNCYRKNPSHKNQFSHPGDSDYDDNADDNRPMCPYGSQCYRSNPQHRGDYRHPTSRPAPKPTSSNRRRGNVDAQAVVDYDSDSQEERDPYSADESSSGSEVFGAGDSDSEYMDEPNFEDMEDSEEVKIMFKEAKKFLRKKRKD